MFFATWEKASSTKFAIHFGPDFFFLRPQPPAVAPRPPITNNETAESRFFNEQPAGDESFPSSANDRRLCLITGSEFLLNRAKIQSRWRRPPRSN